MKTVGEYLFQLLTQALKYYPCHVPWLRLMGDLNFGKLISIFTISNIFPVFFLFFYYVQLFIFVCSFGLSRECNEVLFASNHDMQRFVQSSNS